MLVCSVCYVNTNILTISPETGAHICESCLDKSLINKEENNANPNSTINQYSLRSNQEVVDTDA